MLEKIREDLKNSMKAGDKDRTRTLRMLLTDLKLAQVAKREDLDEGDIFQVIRKSVNQRKDSAQQYREGNRVDLAEVEEREIAILETYLPRQLSDEEIQEEAQKIIQELGVESKKNAGQVMKEFMSRFKGRVDGKKVQGIVLSLLN